MRKTAFLLTLVMLLSGCKGPGARSYWDTHSTDVEDYRVSEEEFADFAELTLAMSPEKAREEIDRLYEKIGDDAVSYIIYSEWIAGAFYSMLSPCMDKDLYVYAADRMLRERVLDDYDLEVVGLRRENCLHNRKGMTAEIPALWDREGNEMTVPLVQKTLFLVVDQDCPSCTEAMTRFISPQWADTWLIALCIGRGPLPVEPGWDCYLMDRDQRFIDTSASPFYFVTAADGTVETGYTLFKK